MENKSVKSLNGAQKSELKVVRGVCHDIDETLSTRGKLTQEAFSALWKLKEAGYFVVSVTGRPAGWCDHIARFWPVDAVIGENGAFIFYMKDGKRQRFDIMSEKKVKEAKEKLLKLKEEILSEFPKASFASDQDYREFDLAVDICEDVSPWGDEEVERLLKFCENKGAHAKLSSIHVNIWFGDYDKQIAMKIWLENGAPGIEGSVPKLNEWLYVGDSPNDEPAFIFFDKSVGVANLKQYLDRLKVRPTWITEKESGEGFCELVEVLTQAK